MLQAIIIHKWHSHARRRLLWDIGLYLLLMVLFIADLCLVGLSMGRSPLDEAWVSGEHRAGTRYPNNWVASIARMEVVMLLMCIRDLWYGLLCWTGVVADTANGPCSCAVDSVCSETERQGNALIY